MTTSIEQRGIREAEPIEVREGHRTRRLVSPGIWPRTNDIRDLPRYMRVCVVGPGGIAIKVQVHIWVSEDGNYVHASADPCGRVRGEDRDASGAFDQRCEVEAERLALENL